MPRINAKRLVERALKREGGKKQVNIAQAMELFGAICFEIYSAEWRSRGGSPKALTDDMIYRLARSHAKRRGIKAEW